MEKIVGILRGIGYFVFKFWWQMLIVVWLTAVVAYFSGRFLGSWSWVIPVLFFVVAVIVLFAIIVLLGTASR